MFACVTVFDSTGPDDDEDSFLIKAYIPDESVEMSLVCTSDDVSTIKRNLKLPIDASSFQIAESIVEILRARREQAGMRIVLSVPDLDRAAAIRIQSQARARIAKKQVHEKRIKRDLMIRPRAYKLSHGAAEIAIACAECAEKRPQQKFNLWFEVDKAESR